MEFLPDSFRLYVAALPLALYLLCVGALHLRRRPYLISGGRDTLGLLLAVGGLAAVGPVELFLPEHAAVRFGSLIWLLLAMLYVLIAVLALTSDRPRWVIYHALPDDAWDALEAACRSTDASATVAGNTIYLPATETELRFECSRRWRTATVVGMHVPSPAAWRQLSRELAQNVARIESCPSWVGPALWTAGAATLALVGWRVAADPPAFAQACRAMLRL